MVDYVSIILFIFGVLYCLFVFCKIEKLNINFHQLSK